MNSGGFSLRSRIRVIIGCCFLLAAVPLLLYAVGQARLYGRHPDVLSLVTVVILCVAVMVLLSWLIENLVFNQLNLLATKARNSGGTGLKDHRLPGKMVNIDRGIVEIFMDEEFSRAFKRVVPPVFRPISDYSAEPYEHQLAHEVEVMLKEVRSLAWSAEGAVDSIKQDIFRHFSHQLKSPMAVVRSHAQQARAAIQSGSPENPQALSSLKGIDEAALSVVSLVDQVLSLASIDHAGRSGFTPSLINLFDVASSVMLERQNLADERDILISTKGDRDCYVMGEPNLLRELVAIFVDNSIRYGKGGCDIEITCRRMKTHVEVIVQDEGAGIPQHERKNVLQPFYGHVGTDDMGRALYGSRRKRSLNTVVKSTHGLGLSLAASIVELHKGILVLDNRPDGKSGLLVCCKFSLPPRA